MCCPYFWTKTNASHFLFLEADRLVAVLSRRFHLILDRYEMVFLRYSVYLLCLSGISRLFMHFFLSDANPTILNSKKECSNSKIEIIKTVVHLPP